MKDAVRNTSSLLKWAGGVLGMTLVAMPGALAQEEVDQTLFDAGQEIYETQCAACHQADGSGMPPTFPALSGNDALDDLEHVVTIIHEGSGAMPPFPNLSADDLAGLVTYIRNAWQNDFGGVSADEIAPLLDGSEPAAERVSVWDGVFTQEQADNGRMTTLSSCAECHGSRLDGAALDPDRTSAPPLARARFLRNWDGQTVGSLFEMIRATMPPASPGFLSDEQYLEVIAYMFDMSDLPPGDAPLGEGVSLSSIVITAEP